MSQTVKLYAYLVSNQWDIKGIKNFLEVKPLFQNYFNFGVSVFDAFTENERRQWIIILLILVAVIDMIISKLL